MKIQGEDGHLQDKKKSLRNQGASHVAPGKSGLHARGEGERVLALESREGTRASRRVDWTPLRPLRGLQERRVAIPAGLSSCSGGLRPLVELCVEPAGLCGRCTGVTVPLRVISHASTEKAMAPHSSTLAWKIPWMEEPGRLQSMGSRKRKKKRTRHTGQASLWEAPGLVLPAAESRTSKDKGGGPETHVSPEIR